MFALVGGLGTENRRRPRLHEPAQGAAALRLDRPQRVRPLDRQNPWTIGWQPDYVGGQGVRPPEPRRTRGWRSCSRTTTTAGSSSRASRAAVGAGRVIATERYEVAAPRRRRWPRRASGSGADTFLVVAHAGARRSRPSWSRTVSAGGRQARQLGRRDRHVPDAGAGGGRLARRGRGHRHDRVPQGPDLADLPERRRRCALQAADGEVRPGQPTRTTACSSTGWRRRTRSSRRSTAPAGTRRGSR